MTYDHTAVALVERFQRLRAIPLGDQVREDVFHVIRLDRFELGTPYREQVERIGNWMQKADIKDACIILDSTGVGKEVSKVFLQAHREGRLGNYWPRPYVITGGRETTGEVVPKRELIGTLLTLLDSERLKIADELPLGPVLQREFLTMREKTTPSGGIAYESARERDHDDIVLAVALACWFRHTLTQPRMLQEVA